MTESKVDEVNLSLNRGINADGNSSSGVGLINVNRRIKLHFGDTYGLQIQSKSGVGTKVILRMPVVRKS